METGTVVGTPSRNPGIGGTTPDTDPEKPLPLRAPEPSPSEVLATLAKMDEKLTVVLDLLVKQRTIKEKYTIAEVARLEGKSEFTVREWCRHGRIRGEKRACGRGTSQEWVISHEELTRYRNEGLLSLAK
jgi:hypothetical protein